MKIVPPELDPDSALSFPPGIVFNTNSFAFLQKVWTGQIS